MTIIREPRAYALRELHRRATREGGEAFADGLCDMIETYRGVAAGEWPQWPTPTNARIEASRIMDAAFAVLSAYGEASEAVRARLCTHMAEAGLPRDALDTGGELLAQLATVHEAAARIYRAQPRTKRGDDTRAGFLHALREYFGAHGVKFTAAATVSEHDGREFTSLAVDAATAALNLKPAAARKAIERAGTLP